jgi:hypothetical protein
MNFQPAASLSAETVWGVGLLIRNRYSQIVFVQELESKPAWGKYAGMWSIPMETIEPDDPSDEAAIERLVSEEVPWLQGFVEDKAEYQGEYAIAPLARARLYTLWSHRVCLPLEPISSKEIGGYYLSHPREAQRLWLRQGVPEMLEDYLAGYSGLVRNDYRIAPPTPPPDALLPAR